MLKGVGNIKFLSVVLTSLIVIILIALGPAQAVILGLFNSAGIVTKGENIVITAKLTPEQTDVINLEKVILKLNGPYDLICEFDRQGNIIKGCNGMTIQTSCFDSYGYSNCGTYGYPNQCKGFEFDIKIDTSKLESAGTYKPVITFKTASGEFKQDGNEFFVKPISYPIPPMERCSIRASNGQLIVEGRDLDGNNKINFYIPDTSKSSSNGRGALNGQRGKDRFSYKFRMNKVEENNENFTIASVIGEYKLGRQNGNIERAIIVFDRKKNEIKILGLDISASNMKVEFKKGCELKSAIKKADDWIFDEREFLMSLDE